MSSSAVFLARSHVPKLWLKTYPCPNLAFSSEKVDGEPLWDLHLTGFFLRGKKPETPKIPLREERPPANIPHPKKYQ